MKYPRILALFAVAVVLPYNPSDATHPAGTLTSDYRWPITLCDPNALRAALLER